MKISKAVVAEQHLTFRVTVEDLKALLPAKYRKLVAEGATFEAKLSPRDANDGALVDGDITLSVFQRSAPKETEIGQ